MQWHERRLALSNMQQHKILIKNKDLCIFLVLLNAVTNLCKVDNSNKKRTFSNLFYTEVLPISISQWRFCSSLLLQPDYQSLVSVLCKPLFSWEFYSVLHLCRTLVVEKRDKGEKMIIRFSQSLSCSSLTLVR